ncbi:MAG TPA: cobalamin-binding protein [Burkholderiales bacterium]|nr:cobalamin-binding protein [Burkholderiales bacterium]
MTTALSAWVGVALLGGLLGACTARAEIVVTDDLGERVALAAPARRIVSLAPHVTELLFAAGAGPQIVGAVEYSDYPPEARAIRRVGGYERLDFEAILALTPDLVVGWESGNGLDNLQRLKQLGLAVFASQPGALPELAATIEKLGALAGTPEAAGREVARFRARSTALRVRYAGRGEVSVFYEIWNQPLMTVNDAHLISDVIRLCGGRNVFGRLRALAPTVNVEDVVRANPEAIVASGSGDARPEWLDDWKRWPRMTAVARGNLYVVPPELIQRATPRVLDGAERLCAALDDARRKRPRS